MTTKDFETMDVSEFRNILELYDELELTDTPYYLQSYMIKEKQSISHFNEKIDFLISHYQENDTFELNQLLDCCCFYLELELLQHMLEKGCKVDEKLCYMECKAPLFRVFLYNYYFMEQIPLDTEKKKEMIQMGKLLIQNGALLEVEVERNAQGKANFVETSKELGREIGILYLNEYKDIFNPVQKRQWNKMRLSSIF